MVNIKTTLGALLLGGLFSAFFSGMVTVQVILYVKLYPNDAFFFKWLVFFVWALDMVHEGLVWRGLWEYFVVRFGDLSELEAVPWGLGTRVIFASVLTFSVNCFYTYRIFILSKRNWLLTCPIAILACVRFSFGVSTFAETTHIHNFQTFRHLYGWQLSVTLALSAFEDVVIMLTMVYLLHRSRRASASLNRVIDLLILYSLEMMLLTAAVSLAAMTCWLVQGESLIFLAILVTRPKFYANSFLATLNSRKHLRLAHSQVRNEEEAVPSSNSNSISGLTSTFDCFSSSDPGPPAPLAVQVKVERSVQNDLERTME